MERLSHQRGDVGADRESHRVDGLGERIQRAEKRSAQRRIDGTATDFRAGGQIGVTYALRLSWEQRFADEAQSSKYGRM